MSATAANSSGTRARDGLVRWARRGLSARPWIHVGAAFAAGVVLYVVLQSAIVVVLVAALPAGLLVCALVAAGVFGALGAWGVRQRAGWWLGLTAVPWFVAAAAAFFAGAAAHGWDSGLWWPYALAGLAPAALALLAHPGPPRALGVLAIVAALGIAIGAKAAADTVAAEEKLGSTIRPDLTTVAGYTPMWETALYHPGSDALVETYRRAGLSTVGYPVAFVLVTERSRTAVCGAPVDPLHNLVEAETSCTRRGDTWSRASKSGHEQARIIDGYLVRVSGPLTTPTSVLSAALDNAKPMNDEYYRHLLFGESGQYVPALDGLR